MKKKKINLFLLFILVVSFILPITGNYINFNTQNKQDDPSKEPEISDVDVGNYLVPGISVSIPESQVIKIGILNDMEDITGEHSWNGAYLAAKEINEAGGVLLGSTPYYVGLVAEDTDEMNSTLDVSKGVNAALDMVNYHDPHYIIGGYRTEAVLAYREVIMDAQIPFMSTGASADDFCQDVLNNYARYKYFFRVIPLNGTSIFIELLTYCAVLFSYLNTTYPSFSTINFGILHEDLPWSASIVAALQTYIPIYIPGASIVETIAFDPALTSLDMATHLTSLEAAGAQIVIPIISSSSGILMGQQYGIVKPQYLLAGINMYATQEDYWDLTFGGGQYEIMMQAIHRTNKTEKTIPFWDSYVAEFGVEPFLTGIGSYDAVYLLANATFEAQSLDPDDIITQLETINPSNPFVGIGSNIAFWESHDLVHGWPYSVGLFCQWQMDGYKRVVTSLGYLYPDSIVTGSLSIPYWGIQNIIDDFSDELPGSFTLTSDASVPDTDGAFDLSWTASDGADRYSLYISEEPITYISKTKTLLLDYNATSPYSISGLKTGEYYFAVVAYNGTGQTFSNNLLVTVELPKPGVFSLTSNAGVPDIDGIFDLSWTPSDGADNYSIYTYDSFISEYNESLTVLADQVATSPFPLSGVPDGVHYYVAIAYNGTGERISNCIQITVDRPKPGNFILSSNADDPDTDGVFDLSWTSSDNSDNYSVYMGSNPITEINESLVLLDDDPPSLMYPLSGFTNGKYHFIVEAWNENGTTASNSIYVEISIPGDEIPIFDGLFLNQTWIDITMNPINFGFTYSHFSGNTYNVNMTFGYIFPAQFDLNAITREITNVGIIPLELNGTHTNRWIYPTTEMGDYYIISTFGVGDHLFQVTGEVTQFFPGFGILDAWILTDLNNQSSYALYEKNIGICLEANFSFGMGLPWYEISLSATNALPPNLPDPFTLSSTAGIPDDDGIFDLTWTSSYNADNYSVYEYNSFITVINGSLTTLGDEIGVLSLPLSGYSDGIYYFIVVAHNEYGDTLSNCIQVTVTLGAPGPFILFENAPDPDEDGIFDLTWTPSTGADTYSIFEYDSYITEINGSLTALGTGITDLTLPLSGYENGTYYFVVTAHNVYGFTMSNCVIVVVAIPKEPDKEPIPGYHLLLTLAILGVCLAYLIRKSMKK